MIELSRGEELDLDGVTRVRMGLGWDRLPNAGAAGSGLPDVDLDASAVQFAGGQLFDLAFYNNLSTRDGSVVHLGDNKTGRGEGDDEEITVDLARVHGPVDTVFFVVSSYQGHSLEWIARASCRIVDEERGTELARFTMTNGVPETGLVLAKLVRQGAGWKLVTIGRGIAMRVPSESTAKLRPFL
ncbi:TerD family protein [Nocardioides aquiterrae]|uniref:TerD family protein n=1 Tax=Nocardioides aquiterrae TaxID=203799 RepID=A0ABN1UAV1_9ACTN